MDPKATENFIKSIFSTLITPEIESRRKRSLISDNYFPEKIQIIFTIDGLRFIRFDEEIRAVIVTNLGTAKVSDNFSVEGLSIQRLDREEEEQDFGHVTLVRVRDLWVLAFDFRYGIQTSKRCYEVGKEFLEVATYAFENKKYRALCANLYLSAENLAKARFFLHPDSELRKTKKHGLIAAKVNIHHKNTKIVSAEYKDTYNFLKRIYDKSRFGEEFTINHEDAKKHLDAIEKFSQEIFQLHTQALFFKE